MRTVRIAMAVSVLAATGVMTATFVSGGGKGTADAATELTQYVPIEQVTPGVPDPAPRRGASTGRFVVDCGTNGNGKFSPDNPVAQPGIRNGAEHVHDFVGNLAITANSSDADLAASGTTCRNGDRSSYFWPVLRIDPAVRPGGSGARQALSRTTPTVSCPRVGDRLPAVPAGAKAAVDRRLAELDRLTAAANARMSGSRGRIDAAYHASVIDPLRARRAQLIRAISESVGGDRGSARLVSLVDCDVSYDSMHAFMGTDHASAVAAAAAATPQVWCPAVRGRLPGVPASALDEVDRALAELDRQISEADERLVVTRGGASVLGTLKARRAAVLDRIATAVDRLGPRPRGLEALAACTLSKPAPPAAPAAQPSASALPEPQGRNLELPNNTGPIQRPRSVLIEYRGNAAGKVVAMPRFLRALTGDAKPTSRGPANARPSWTCSGFADRLSATYPICPPGSQVQRVHDFPGCWDGKNVDSDNHRSHVAFADRGTGACPRGFRAIPQLRITLSYDIPRDVQLRGQFALDSFPEEDHNPFSDHDDFVNVNSARQMRKIVSCINEGRQCGR
ncbi:DUF1996 domain-containing protein [Couchioplanes azureus]|uniref:DUF1996 domain-containing protein n=1 Tax=Couchioplanes caeruleus TaxID=56438 RepID=UPI0019971AAA|nr:DUF1996 domain-containing protein [Couchioplanes caeruleus]GGQ40156.1 hypothetical protein GCM10010166_03930 [Couchioplanes caeruleus subsp. azureus]